MTFIRVNDEQEAAALFAAGGGEMLAAVLPIATGHTWVFEDDPWLAGILLAVRQRGAFVAPGLVELVRSIAAKSGIR